MGTLLQLLVIITRPIAAEGASISYWMMGYIKLHTMLMDFGLGVFFVWSNDMVWYVMLGCSSHVVFT